MGKSICRGVKQRHFHFPKKEKNVSNTELKFILKKFRENNIPARVGRSYAWYDGDGQFDIAIFAWRFAETFCIGSYLLQGAINIFS